jgi:hypothetical protein
VIAPITTARLCVPQSRAAAQDLHLILYTAWGRLCSVSPGGGDQHCLRSINEFDSPSWQPGGTRIAAEMGQHDGPHSLTLLNARGRPIRRLDSSSGYIRPVWSPDGRHIFAVNYDLGSAISRWDANGGSKTVLRVGGGPEPGRAFQMISFSPSGKRAALLTMDFREMVLATVDDSLFSVFANLPRDFSYVSQSVWVDEEHLLFIGKRDTNQGELWQLSISDGSVTKRGIEGLWLRDQIAISPDRQSVVVTAVEGSARTDWNVWKSSLVTQRRSRLTNGTEDVVASWR